MKARDSRREVAPESGSRDRLAALGRFTVAPRFDLSLMLDFSQPDETDDQSPGRGERCQVRGGRVAVRYDRRVRPVWKKSTSVMTSADRD